jgi:soluble lytic murein transglycosylase-like protein
LKRKTIRRLAWLTAAAAVGLAGVCGTYYYLRWRHDEAIEARLNRLAPIIWKYAQANTLPTELVREMIRAESGGDERAVSARNAKGLMQVTPVALEEVRRRNHLGSGDLFDADYNIHVGTAYLRWLLDEFDGDVYLALAGYNMGPTKLFAACRANPKMSGREIVEKVAPPVTIRYCRTILHGREVRLPGAPEAPTKSTVGASREG